jgi:serine/threonine-protein kinase
VGEAGHPPGCHPATPDWKAGGIQGQRKSGMSDSTQVRTAVADTADADLSGRDMGDYRILRRLGRGAMAEVYLAEQKSLSRQVAIKVLKGQLAKDETYLARFYHEAKAAASMVHANIVQIHEVGCFDGTHYIAQEYVQGQNLREYMVRQGLPDVRLAINVIRQVAAALSKAAERGIIHRDIKPENILIARTGEVKVADFGLSRLTDGGQTVNLTQIGITMGTPMYMSPEQVEGKSLDPRSDIYSFGVTCYHMLAGNPPFTGDTALSVAVQHLKKQPERLETIRPDLPAGLCRIVHKMLSKNPAHRYSTARELIKDLKVIAVELAPDEWDSGESAWTVPDETAGELPPSEATKALAKVMLSEGVQRNRRWGVWGWAAAAVLTAALGGGLAVLTREPNLLEVPPVKENEIKKLGTVQEQMYLASTIVDPVLAEKAWRSVIEYFPEAVTEGRRAKQQLARIYLNQDRFDEALQLFEELASLDSTEEEFRAFGLAGKFIILSLRQDQEQSLRTLEEFFGVRDKLMDTEIAAGLRYALESNQELAKTSTALELQKKFEADEGEQQPVDNGSGGR